MKIANHFTNTVQALNDEDSKELIKLYKDHIKTAFPLGKEVMVIFNDGSTVCSARKGAQPVEGSLFGHVDLTPDQRFAFLDILENCGENAHLLAAIMNHYKGYPVPFDEIPQEILEILKANFK